MKHFRVHDSCCINDSFGDIVVAHHVFEDISQVAKLNSAEVSSISCSVFILLLDCSDMVRLKRVPGFICSCVVVPGVTGFIEYSSSFEMHVGDSDDFAVVDRLISCFGILLTLFDVSE